MPATEDTWRSTRKLHLIFCLSSVALFLSTLWMLYADHHREWKEYQRTFQRVEAWSASAREEDQRSATYLASVNKLRDAYDQTRLANVDSGLLQQFMNEAEKQSSANGYKLSAIKSASEELSSSISGRRPNEEIIVHRGTLLAAMNATIRTAKFVEDNSSLKVKFRRADLDQTRSHYDLAIKNELADSEVRSLGKQVDEITADVNKMTLEYQANRTHRLQLQRIVSLITKEEDSTKKRLDDEQGKLVQLHQAALDRDTNIAKRMLQLPIIDAFGRPIKIEQVWLPDLTINYNFKNVARFDRCITCHQAIDKTAPGSATLPGYPGAAQFTVELTTPTADPHSPSTEAQSPAAEENPTEVTTESIYGLVLAERGLLNEDDVTVEVVRPNSSAADAQLLPGDVLVSVNGAKLLDRATAVRNLVTNVTQWGRPLRLEVRRGLPHPYASHPRLDLFVGSLSPHKMNEFGCTSCHEGQGSATAFKWASHTPNTLDQMHDWEQKHGWFNNHHWIFPQNPQRFAESSCLKCHHEVTELKPSEKFPDPPAPTLVKGYELIKTFGCFGCHEINGFDGPNKRRGPDLRAEPGYAGAAAQLLRDDALTTEEKDWASQVASRPELVEPRHRLSESLKLRVAAARGTSQASGDSEQAAENANPIQPWEGSDAVTKLLPLLEDEESPGQLNKVGPSLRYVKSKLNLPFLMSWLKEPKNFRPSTKMPQFFGLHDHLQPEGKDDPTIGLGEAKRYEPVEIRAIAEYLLFASDELKPLDFPKEVTEEPSIERGKLAFEVRGCLACHQHADFPEATSTVGPNLSRMGAKLRTPAGERWLYGWVRNPSRYHARTIMPNLFLEPVARTDEKGKAIEPQQIEDPADDITAFLINSQQDWTPESVPDVDEKALDDLAMKYLKASFSTRQAEKYLEEGIPDQLKDEVKVDERILVGEGMMSVEKKLLYVGRRTITRLGCTGCHDVPGLEDAKPIGTGLADWGRKEPSKLAFESIVPYLAHRFRAQEEDRLSQDAEKEGSEITHSASESAHGLSPSKLDPETGYFVQAILSHQREGFLWQKLREPRSYDYRKTENKDYTERLRMPKFNLSDEDVQSIMTFVLGLVAEPPANKYVYQPKGPRKAVLEGQKVIEKYNCGGCHKLGHEKWEIDYEYDPNDPNKVGDPVPFADFSFLMPHLEDDLLQTSKLKDRRGKLTATLVGMPVPSAAPPAEPDEEPDPEAEEEPVFFRLWQPSALAGQVWLTGAQVPVMEKNIRTKRPADGGTFASYLHPRGVVMGKAINPNTTDNDVWSWVPPPLIGEGTKVQSQWLHDFLLDPFPIRPAVMLRMPKFHMSSEEATKIANYFAARDGAESFEFDPRARVEYLQVKEQELPGRLDDALRIVTNDQYCVKCHKVGNYTPEGRPTGLAPRLDRVHTRLRPEFVRNWLANPLLILPYTGMPQNFKVTEPAKKQFFEEDPHGKLIGEGTSEQQIDAIVDLLLNYDTVMKNKVEITVKKVKVPPMEPGNAAEGQ